MKNKIMSTLFGMALLMVGACSQNNGQAVAQQENNLPFAKEIGDSNGYIIRRFVDCDAKTFVYTVNGAISVVTARELNGDGTTYLYNMCRGQ